MEQAIKTNRESIFVSYPQKGNDRTYPIRRGPAELLIYYDDVDSGYVSAVADTVTMVLNNHLKEYDDLFKENLIKRREEYYKMDEKFIKDEYPTINDYVKSHMDYYN